MKNTFLHLLIIFFLGNLNLFAQTSCDNKNDSTNKYSISTYTVYLDTIKNEYCTDFGILGIVNLPESFNVWEVTEDDDSLNMSITHWNPDAEELLYFYSLDTVFNFYKNYYNKSVTPASYFVFEAELDFIKSPTLCFTKENLISVIQSNTIQNRCFTKGKFISVIQSNTIQTIKVRKTNNLCFILKKTTDSSNAFFVVTISL